jgi:hypothetical protein
MDIKTATRSPQRYFLTSCSCATTVRWFTMSTVVLSSSGSQCLYFSANDHPIPAAISPCSFPLPSLPLPLFLSFSLFSCDHPTCLSLEARLTVPSPPLLAGGRTIFVTWSTLDLILHTVGGRVLNRVDISFVRVHVHVVVILVAPFNTLHMTCSHKHIWSPPSRALPSAEK